MRDTRRVEKQMRNSFDSSCIFAWPSGMPTVRTIDHRLSARCKRNCGTTALRFGIESLSKFPGWGCTRGNYGHRSASNSRYWIGVLPKLGHGGAPATPVIAGCSMVYLPSGDGMPESVNSFPPGFNNPY